MQLIRTHMRLGRLLITAAALCWPGWNSFVALSDEPPSSADKRLYEIRTYYAHSGKLDALQARFRNHTIKLFQKHGMENLGYWLPVENSEDKLIYILAYPSRQARESSWKAFFADPEWQSVQKASEAGGRLVAKVDSVFLSPTDYSPPIKPARSPLPRLFELRSYTAPPGKLSELNRRFRDHTVGLFAKHGISNIGYWIPTDKGQGADNTLIYLIAHKDQAAAQDSWKAFRADPEWVAAKAASEANGPLTVPNGVKSIYLTPADYSPMN
jgi:hypothetical protein